MENQYSTIILFCVLAILPITLYKCTSHEKSDLQMVYTVDKEGLFLYDLNTGKKKKIYSTNQLFLERKMEFLSDDDLLVAHQNKISRPTTDRERLTETFFLVNLDSGTNYKYKTVEYEYIERKNLKTKTTYFNHNGEIKSTQDTIVPCNSASYGYRNVEFMPPERGFSKSENRNGVQVFSERGNLYLANKADTTLLLEFDGRFKPKFGGGFYNPTLSPDRKKIFYQYLAGLRLTKRGSAIYEMDLETKEKKQFIKGYFKPRYSPDGKKLLLAKNSREHKKNTWISSIYVLDIESKRETKVGNGSYYLWRPLKPKEIAK